MKMFEALRVSRNLRFVSTAVLLCAPLPLLAQTATPAAPTAPATESKEYVPVSGQAGKDSVWVPSPVSTVERMLDIAKLTPRDFVVDLGSGDGRNVILAAKRGARGLGVEFNPDLVELSKRNATKEGVAHLAQFVQGDMFAADFSKATVLALFLLPDNLRKLEPKFRQLRPGTRIVANTFGIDGWTPEQEVNITGDCTAWCKVLLYIVPASVAGSWRGGADRFEIAQSAQSISGAVVREGKSVQLENGLIHGVQIRFTVAGARYAGTLKGNRIEGTVNSGGQRKSWSVSKAI